MRPRAYVFALAGLGVAACFDFGGLSADSVDTLDASVEAAVGTAPAEAGPDSMADAAKPPPPPGGFSLTVSPVHVTLDPNDATNVTVSLTRGAAFTEALDITVQGQGADLVTNPPSLTMAGATSQASFSVKASGTAAAQELVLDVVGVARTTTSVTAKAALAVRVGSLLLATTTGGTLPLPPYTKGVVVKVWGAGGGAGSNAAGLGYPEVLGGTGGVGGFATATLPIDDPSVPLVLTVGTGGGVSTSRTAGGGGGGYSQVARGGVPLVVVGGGGGGGAAFYYRDSITCAFTGNGGAGSPGAGGDAQSGAGRSATRTTGGLAGGDGATAGTSLKGGDGASPAGQFAPGGVPGGGRGGVGFDGCTLMATTTGGGGGGGGWFGGGGGPMATTSGNAQGGGGSGMVIAAATDVVTSAGGGTADPDYLAPAAVGGTPVATNSGGPTAGASGRIVVRLAKP